MMKKIWLSVFALSLSACGFTPVHAPKAAGETAAFNNIRVEMRDAEKISDSKGSFTLEQQLYNRLGTQGGNQVLTVQASFSRRGLGISSNDIASRFVLYGKAKYSLTNAQTGETLLADSVTTNVTFGAPRDPYGLNASTEEATDRVAIELADRLLTRLAAYYASPERYEAATTTPADDLIGDDVIQIP